MKIVGLMGAAGCGKDTVANFLVEKHGFQKMSFAKTVKDVASVAFDWDRSLLEGDTNESRAWRERMDPYWNVTPRAALQLIGTDMFRDLISDDFWLKRLRKELEKATTPIVISDCRYENEADYIKALGGTIVYVQRDEAEAKTHEAVRRIASGTLPIEAKRLLLQTLNNYVIKGTQQVAAVHPSEWAFYGYDHDAVVHNNGTIEELYTTIGLKIVQ